MLALFQSAFRLWSWFAFTALVALALAHYCGELPRANRPPLTPSRKYLRSAPRSATTIRNCPKCGNTRSQ